MAYVYGNKWMVTAAQKEIVFAAISQKRGTLAQFLLMVPPAGILGF